MAAHLVGLIGARAQLARGRVHLAEEVVLEAADRDRVAGGARDREVDVIGAHVRELRGGGGAEAAGQLGGEGADGVHGRYSDTRRARSRAAGRASGRAMRRPRTEAAPRRRVSRPGTRPRAP